MKQLERAIASVVPSPQKKSIKVYPVLYSITPVQFVVDTRMVRIDIGREYPRNQRMFFEEKDHGEKYWIWRAY